MCNEAMYDNPAVFFLIPDRFKTREMCINAVEVDPWQFHDVPYHFKTQEMCDGVVRDDPFSLQFVLDWFMTQQQVKLWHDNDDYCNNNELIKWYDGYQKRKTLKAQIKCELMPIASHPDCVMDWCMSGDERWWK